MSTPSPAEWGAIRNKWENTPRLTFGEAGEGFAVSRQAIAVKAKKEGWEKSATLSTINQQAHRKADGIPVDGIDGIDGIVQVVDPLEVTTEEAIDIRANILAEQRNEIKTIPKLQSKAISLFDVAIKASAAAKDTDDTNVKSREKAAWAVAKLAADTVKTHATIIQMKQDSEAKAWGLDIFQLEDRLLPNIKLMTDDELNYIVDKGEYPAYMTKGLRL